MHCRRAPNKVENQVRPIFVKMTEKLRLVRRLSRLGPMPPHRTQPATMNLLHGLPPAREIRRREQSSDCSSVNSGEIPLSFNSLLFRFVTLSFNDLYLSRTERLVTSKPCFLRLAATSSHAFPLSFVLSLNLKGLIYSTSRHRATFISSVHVTGLFMCNQKQNRIRN